MKIIKASTDSCVFMAKQYFNVLFNGFELDILESDKKIQEFVPVTLAHFCPVNEWKVLNEHFIQDVTTKDAYFNESDSLIRKKCVAVFFGTIVLQSIGLILNCINRILKLVTLAHFWVPSPDDKYHFEARVEEGGRDILRVVLTPLIFVGLILASLYGMSDPKDARKEYASFARFAYSGGYKLFRNFSTDYFMFYLIAPCFQPHAAGHFFGGDLHKKDQW